MTEDTDEKRRERTPNMGDFELYVLGLGFYP